MHSRSVIMILGPNRGLVNQEAHQQCCENEAVLSAVVVNNFTMWRAVIWTVASTLSKSLKKTKNKKKQASNNK